MKLIDPKLHGALDYSVAAVLVIAPLVFGFATTSTAAALVAVSAGVSLFLYSLFTDYAAGVRAFIPFRVHLALDAVAGVFLVASPYLLAFDGTARLFYVTMGIADLLVVATTRSPNAALIELPREPAAGAAR